MAIAQLSKVKLEYFPHGDGAERVVFIHGFHVNGLLPGILAAIVTGVASWVGGMVMGDAKR